MRSDLNLTLNTRSLSALAGFLALAGGHAAAQNSGAEQSAEQSPDQYTWSAELVSVDQGAGTATVKARVVGHHDIEDLSAFSQGDSVTITWSGYNWASGVRDVTAGTDASGRFTLPAEFVSFEMDGRYVVFEVPVPGDDMSNLTALSSGEWVTLTSPADAGSPEQAVADARAYSNVG